MTLLRQPQRAPATEAAGAAAGERPLRVVLVSDDLCPGFGGLAISGERHAATLAALGHEVHALAGPERHPTPPPPGVRLTRLPGVRIDALQATLILGGLRRTQVALRAADVVHVNAPTPFGLAVLLMARRRGIRTIAGVHVQGESSQATLGNVGAAVAWVLNRWYRFVFRRADHCVSPTPFAAELAQTLTGRRATVVSNGVDVPRELLGRADARTQLPASWRPAPNERLLVYLGRLSQEKRPGDLLDLAKRMRTPFKLLLAGHGPLAGVLEQRIRAEGLEGKVLLTGFVAADLVPTLWMSADLAMMPSSVELQSIASLEAMAHGTPVVAYDHPASAVPRWVDASGAGLVVPPSDPSAVAARVDELLADEERLLAMRSAARAYAAQHALPVVARRLASVYRGAFER